eukprot:SAG11_NODE_3483_length_2418_cov_75.244502_3_plen_76_part_00
MKYGIGRPHAEGALEHNLPHKALPREWIKQYQQTTKPKFIILIQTYKQFAIYNQTRRTLRTPRGKWSFGAVYAPS